MNNDQTPPPTLPPVDARDPRLASLADLVFGASPLSQWVIDKLGEKAAAIVACVRRADFAGYLGMGIRDAELRGELGDPEMTLRYLEAAQLIARRPMNEGGARVGWALVLHPKHHHAMALAEADARSGMSRRRVVLFPHAKIEQPRRSTAQLVEEIVAEFLRDEMTDDERDALGDV